MARTRRKTEANVAAGWAKEAQVYVSEVDPTTRKALDEEKKRAGKVRRRIEDIKEAARIEREVFEEDMWGTE